MHDDEPTKRRNLSPAELRARAARIRQDAQMVHDDESEPRMLGLAADLEAEADAMEREGAPENPD
jgi:hypothetical protein